MYTIISTDGKDMKVYIYRRRYRHTKYSVYNDYYPMPYNIYHTCSYIKTRNKGSRAVDQEQGPQDSRVKSEKVCYIHWYSKTNTCSRNDETKLGALDWTELYAQGVCTYFRKLAHIAQLAFIACMIQSTAVWARYSRVTASNRSKATRT